jgi:lipopolysaccharide biosynthesis glycosyltransferase
MLRSVDAHVRDASIPIFVLSPDLTEGELSEISPESTSRAIDLVRADPDALANLPLGDRDWRTPSVYLPLMLPGLLPRDTQVVLYLDCDMLVLEDLTPLFDTPLDGTPVGAVRDWHSPCIGSWEGVGAWKSLGLDPRLPALNSGVLLLDLDRWRAEDITARTLEFVDQYRDTIRLYDQEAMNAVLSTRWKELDPRWNVQSLEPRPAVTLYDPVLLEEAFARPAVQHFIGPYKPWQLGPTSPRLRAWFDVLDQTPYGGWRPSTLQRRLRGIRRRGQDALRSLRG